MIQIHQWVNCGWPCAFVGYMVSLWIRIYHISLSTHNTTNKTLFLPSNISLCTHTVLRYKWLERELNFSIAFPPIPCVCVYISAPHTDWPVLWMARNVVQTRRVPSLPHVCQTQQQCGGNRYMFIGAVGIENGSVSPVKEASDGGDSREMRARTCIASSLARVLIGRAYLCHKNMFSQ